VARIAQQFSKLTYSKAISHQFLYPTHILIILAFPQGTSGLAQPLALLLLLQEKILHLHRQVSKTAIVRCKAITHRLLALARRMDVILEEIKLNELIPDVLNFLTKEAMYNRIPMEIHIQENLPTVCCDKGQLQQIFLRGNPKPARELPFKSLCRFIPTNAERDNNE